MWWEETGAGPGVVLVHAGIADARMWDPQWEALAGEFRLVRYDLRGCGRSPASDGKPFRHADDLAALLDAAGLERASIVGASMGCGVAAELALAHPARVERLVLASPTLGGFPWGDEAQAYQAEDAALALENAGEARVELALRMWLDGVGRKPGDVDAGARRAVAEMVHHALGREGDQEGVAWLADGVWSRVDELRRFPVLTILGAHDVPTVQATARALVDRAGAQGAQLGGAAHFPNLERAQAFNDLVRGFLRARRK